MGNDVAMRVIVVGPLTPGPLLTVNVADVGRISSYTSALVEVAGRDGNIKGPQPVFVVTMSRLSGR